MDRVSGNGGAAAPAGKRPAAVKPGVAFKQAMLRAMEARPPEPPPAQPRRPAPAVAAAAPPRPVTPPERPGAFHQLIARLESSAPSRPDQGYGARNPASGALGRYQLLPVALRDIGWQDAAGQWTPLAASHGVRSEGDFLGTPAAQEAAMAAFLRRAEIQLERNGSLARSGGSVAGLDGGAVPLTESGLVAAAHRSGAHSVARYLAHRGGDAEAPLSHADRATFTAVERRLRQFAELPYQVATRRASPAG
jgi:hypothetical protein